MHLVAWLPPGISGQHAFEQAAAQGLNVQVVTQHNQHTQQRDGLVLGFATTTPQELQAGVKMLARALRG
ncbi:hypothetical protein KDW_60860 [Dictyobacter vulcani]|uniref:Aminotransferase class I/classII domain-containing protein n=1 Tax=Dictyobacter vulcani TaxID=2607529 RepID=A0A5J4KRC7_9CHLR|nr:hypothetical protein KDW_60860 [Dictyobacter vulcani]